MVTSKRVLDEHFVWFWLPSVTVVVVTFRGATHM
jgi:hypothetical protein